MESSSLFAATVIPHFFLNLSKAGRRSINIKGEKVKKLLIALISFTIGPGVIHASCPESADYDASIALETSRYNGSAANYVAANNEAINNKASQEHHLWWKEYYKNHGNPFMAKVNAVRAESDLARIYENNADIRYWQEKMRRSEHELKILTDAAAAICAAVASSTLVPLPTPAIPDDGEVISDDEIDEVNIQMNRLFYAGSSTVVAAPNADMDFLEDLATATATLEGTSLKNFKLYDSSGVRISIPSGTSLKFIYDSSLFVVKVTRNDQSTSILIDRSNMNAFLTKDTAITAITGLTNSQIKNKTVTLNGVSKSVLDVKAINGSGATVNIGLYLENDEVKAVDL